MQTRPYSDEDGLRVWLSRSDQEQLLDIYRDEYPKRTLALQLGLHGLRSDEIVEVAREDFRDLDGEADRYKLVIPDGKTGKREVPIATEVRQAATMLSNAAGLRQEQPLIDVETRTLRYWIEDARDEVLDEVDDSRDRRGWSQLGMHDLRRSWATDAFYSLAFSGVPIAEELTMSWGGWAMTASGRETFRENYLGPEPDHVAVRAMEQLSL